MWAEIVRGVITPETHGVSEAKDVTKKKKMVKKKNKKNKKKSADDDDVDDDNSCDNDDDDDDDDDDDKDDDEGDDNLLRPVDTKEDNMYHAVFQKLFGILKQAFVAVTKDILIPHYDATANSMTTVSLESRIKSEWDMDSIVGVNIWGRANIPLIFANTESVEMASKSKLTDMSQESKGDGNDGDDGSYSPSDNDSESEEEGEYVASQRDVENLAVELETPLWINANGFIKDKMRSKSSELMCYVNSQCLFLIGEELRSWRIGNAKITMLENMYANQDMIPTILFAKQDTKWFVQPTPSLSSDEDIEKQAKKHVKRMSIYQEVCISKSIFLIHNNTILY